MVDGGAIERRTSRAYLLDNENPRIDERRKRLHFLAESLFALASADKPVELAQVGLEGPASVREDGEEELDQEEAAARREYAKVHRGERRDRLGRRDARLARGASRSGEWSGAWGDEWATSVATSGCGGSREPTAANDSYRPL